MTADRLTPKEDLVSAATGNLSLFDSIIQEMRETYIKKDHDYGNSFEKSCDEFGAVAGIVRLSDKFNRLKSLVKNQDQMVNDESLVDTVTDMANYCVLLRMWLSKQ